MSLKKKLEYHYKAFDRSKLEPDPLQFPHMFHNEEDIELVSFIASVFAYGNMKQIINSMNAIVSFFGSEPYNFLLSVDKNYLLKNLSGMKHRFYSEQDILLLLLTLKKILEEYRSLKNLFFQNYIPSKPNPKDEISAFSKELLKTALRLDDIRKLSYGLKFMFPLPGKGSTCKRMNLFLRWMVRKDELDFGLWAEIPTSKLIIPVDTHVARICKQLKLTKRKNVGWKMAEEITENLKKFDSADPVKYDFAICHIGMRKLSF